MKYNDLGLYISSESLQNLYKKEKKDEKTQRT